MEYFENLVRLPEIETQRSFLSKYEYLSESFNILINRGRVLDTVCQRSRLFTSPSGDSCILTYFTFYSEITIHIVNKYFEIWQHIVL